MWFFKSLIFTLLLIPGIAYAGAWSIGGVTIDLRDITLLNTGCINIEDSLDASVGVLCLDGNDDLNIGDATAVDNINLNTIGTTTIVSATDIQWGGISLTIGADDGTNTVTNVTRKFARIGAPHYTNAEEPLAIIIADSQAGSSFLLYGGGDSNFNTTVSHIFYVASDTTTTGGTELLKMTTSLIDVSGADIKIDSGRFYRGEQSTSGTVRNLLGFSTDTVQLGALTNDLSMLGLTNINISSGTGTNTLVEVQAATARTSELRMAGFDVAGPATAFLEADNWLRWQPISGTAGGASLTVASDTDAAPFQGLAIFGTANPNDATPAWQFRCAISDGSTGINPLAAAETCFQVSIDDGTTDLFTILGSGAEVLVNSDTTGDAWTLTADALTTGNLIIAQSSITASGLTNRSAGNNLVDITVSRVDSRTSGTTADDFDLMSLARTQEASGASGTLTAAGSVLKLENIATASAGTLTDTVAVLELVQSADSTGRVVFLNQDGNGTSLYIDTESTIQPVIYIPSPATTIADIILLENANFLTTGGFFNAVSTISTDGLTARTTGNNYFDLVASRIEESTSATTSDDYDLMSLSRTSITTGAGGTLNSTGSVLKLQNTVTQTAGTLADTVAVLELVQDTDSTGITLSVDSNGANTKPIMSIENTAGDIEIFRTDATPESAVTGSIGDLAIDGTGGILYIKNTGSATNTGWNAIGGMPTFKSYTFVARDAASGVNFSAGFYNAPTSSVVLTIGGSVTQTHGGANAPYAAHAIVVASGAGGTDLVLTVSGTSILDDGTRTGADSEIIVADTDTAGTNDYFETTKKWLGQITYTLTGASGAFTFNYGYAKYDDFGNRNFTVTDFETIGLANANDSSFDIELLHHKATGWTYSAGSFVPGSTVIAGMNAIHSTEQDLDAGEPFAFKRAGLSTLVSGNNAEGIVIRVTTGTNNSISYMDSHVGVLIR